jgi:dienelactone hydrolase
LCLSILLLSACGGEEAPGGQFPITTTQQEAGVITADAGSTGGLTAGGTGGLTAGGTASGGLTAGGLTAGGLTAGGLTAGGLTAGGLTAGGLTAGGSPGGSDAGTPGGRDAGSTAGGDGGTVGGTTGGDTDGGSAGGGGPYMRGPEPTAEALTKDGTYKVENTTKQGAGGFRDGPDFAEATLWWPSDATPPFASVAVVPGWVSTEADIRTWGPYLASYGLVVLTIGTNSPATDQPPERAKALLDALESIRQENTRADGPLKGKLDLTRQATMGWSMGGGGSLLAGEQTPSLKAVISMCGWNPGYNYSKVKVPALMFASKGDSLAGGQSQGFYDSIPNTTPKELWEVDGGNHFFFNTPKANNGIVGRYGLSWLKVYLEGDPRYKTFIMQMPASKTEFRTNVQ